MKVGNLELEVAGKINIEGEEYTVVNVPDADEYRGFPPSWEFVKSHMLTWRPYFRGKLWRWARIEYLYSTNSS